MSAIAQAWSHETEADFLEGLRARYEADGFTFTIPSPDSKLPEFFGPYVPDAIARKPGLNIAIEVKRQQSQSTQARLQDIRQRFEGHADWKFSVFFGGGSPLDSTIIPSATPDAIRRRVEEVRALNQQGSRRAAFVMAWSLVEAVLQTVDADAGNKPRTPGTVVQALAMNGYIDAEAERQMRSLIVLRNKIVHGDLVAEPTTDQVDFILAAIEQTLGADAA